MGLYFWLASQIEITFFFPIEVDKIALEDKLK